MPSLRIRRAASPAAALATWQARARSASSASTRHRRVVHRGGRPLERERHVGELVLDRLERADRHVELLALLRVRERHVEDPARGADHLGRERRRARGRATRRAPSASSGCGSRVERVGVELERRGARSRPSRRSAVGDGRRRRRRRALGRAPTTAMRSTRSASSTNGFIGSSTQRDRARCDGAGCVVVAGERREQRASRGTVRARRRSRSPRGTGTGRSRARCRARCTRAGAATAGRTPTGRRCARARARAGTRVSSSLRAVSRSSCWSSVRVKSIGRLSASGGPSTRWAMMLRWISERAARDRVGEASRRSRATQRPCSSPRSASVTGAVRPCDLHAELVQRPCRLRTSPSSCSECSGADEPCANDAKPL